MRERSAPLTFGYIVAGIGIVGAQLVFVVVARSPEFGLVLLAANALLPFFLYRRPGLNVLGAAILIAWTIAVLLSTGCTTLYFLTYNDVAPGLIAFAIGATISAAIGWSAARMLKGSARRAGVDVDAFD